MINLLRSSPGVAISLALFGGGALVCAIVGFVMARSGASLRPMYWFAGLLALVVVPQLVGHLLIALRKAAAEAPHTAALKQVAQAHSAEGGPKAGEAKTLFGPDADPQLITDARDLPGGVFRGAELAQFAVLPNGDTVLVARFDGHFAAEKAWIEYLRTTGWNQLDGKGNSQSGYLVTRPSGDRAYALHLGNMVGVWTGKDDAAIRDRMVAGGFEIPRRAPLNDVTTASAAKAPASTKTRKNLQTRVLIGLGIALYAVVVARYFFQGAAWAGTYRAKPGTTPVNVSELAARLEAVNQCDVPFRIERGSGPNEFFASWRYADAKWIDLARLRGMRRTTRVRLVADEAAKVVRATDHVASYDWSAGRGGSDLEWKAGVGLVLFQREHQRVFGLQLDEQGRFKPEPSYAYTFRLEELKAPLMEAVTRAGWDWRPTVWQGPTWLRWLTK